MARKIHYSKKPERPEKVAKAMVTDQRVHFKNTYETARAIKGMTLERARQFLENVKAKKEIVPFRRFNGGVGRKAQAKQWGTTQGRWPKKSAVYLLALLKNAESNAQTKQLEMERLFIEHIVIQRAAKHHRRTHRAHGRITAYNASCCHMEMMLMEKPEPVSMPMDTGQIGGLLPAATATRAKRMRLR